MSFCKNCVEGVRHEGTLEGSIEELGGIKTYVAKPQKGYAKEKAVIYLGDIFGIELPNNCLLADSYARNGFQTYAPDLFADDAAPLGRVYPDGTAWDLKTWFPKHTPASALERVRAVMTALRAQGVTKFAAAGYCYGGRLTFDLAFADEIDVSVVSHPALLTPPDLKKYAEAKAPLLLNTCEHDEMFGAEMQAGADEALSSFEPGYKRAYFAGATHGFASRGDLSDPVVKKAKEDAFENAVEWLVKYL
ncbi:unnamed protein product [Peniophora sp. CBMAI 1063]|nr:unnamed protein product [Peniophora sp. CBMAI 1063]